MVGLPFSVINARYTLQYMAYSSPKQEVVPFHFMTGFAGPASIAEFLRTSN